MTAVGIDLGTTNSAAAFWDGVSPKLINNALGETLTPSVVGIDDNGELIVGAAAKDRLLTHPTLTASRFKQWMGSDSVAQLGNHALRPEELSAIVLKSLYADIVAHLSDPPTEIVITVPAYFSDPQRKATLAAAQLAGLPAARLLVNEPTAAALAYGLQEQGDGQFIVLDLGGGTFDVTILDKYEGIMEVRASAGDSRLGGEDFSDKLAEFLAMQNKLTLDSTTRMQRIRLRRYAELMKCNLSSCREAPYVLDLDGVKLEGVVTREAFEEHVAALTARLRFPIERALRDSSVRLDSIKQVILVGGATRMPLMRRLASKLFGRIPLTTLDPDHIVALGAAVRAAMTARHDHFSDIVMTDVCPHTLGTSVLEGEGRVMGEVMSPIIERNAVVPISRVERYRTVHAGQRFVGIDVYQGEHLRPKDNVKIGEVQVTVPPAPKGSEAVEVRFTYDASGALEVEVTIVSTGEKHTKLFQNGAGLSDAEIRQRFEQLAAIKIAPRDQGPNRALIAHAERLYAESNGEIRDVLKDAIMRFSGVIESQQNRKPEEARKDLKVLLTDIERHLFGATLPFPEPDPELSDDV